MAKKLSRWANATMAALIALLSAVLPGCKETEQKQDEPVPQQTAPAQDEQTPASTAPQQDPATEPSQEDPTQDSTQPEEMVTDPTEEVTEQTTTSTEEDDSYWETIDPEDIPNPSIPDMTDLG